MTARMYAAARALLAAVLPAELRDPIVGDIEAEVAVRRASQGPGRATWWGARQCVGSLPAAVRLRAMTRTAASPRLPHRSGGLMLEIGRDVRYAWRILRAHPLVAGAAIATMALGIGATTTIFSIVHAALLRELPYHEPDRIVRVYESFGSGFSRGVAHPSNYDYWERHASSFSHLSAIRASSTTLTGAGEATRVRVDAVMPAFFNVMGVGPALGRRFTDADAHGAAPPVLLSHALWTTRFGGDPTMIGRTIVLDGVAREVAGVMPAWFRFPSTVDAWQPLHLDAKTRGNPRGAWSLGVVARLKPGVTVEQAQAEMTALSEALLAHYPARQKGRGASVVPLHDDLVFQFANGLRLLQGAVVLVLLIAVANVANLLLAQSTGRRREFGIRAAVGAGRGRLARQVLTESLLIGAAGATAGVLLALWGVRALVAFSPLRLPPGMEPAVDAPVLIFTVSVAVAASLVFGMAPALVTSRTDLVDATRQGSSGTGRRGGGLRSGLVVAEIALAVILLAGGGLLMRSFALVMQQDRGFDARRVLTAHVALPARYDTPAERLAFWRTLFDRLGALPGTTAVGASTAVPFSTWEWQTAFRFADDARLRSASVRTVNAGYFAALGVPVVAGRTFGERDLAGAEDVVLVNEAFVRSHLAGRPPIGERIRVGRGDDLPYATIVGVVGSTRHVRLEEPPQPEIYRPIAQQPPTMLVLAVRSSAGDRDVAAFVRAAVREIDDEIPVESLLTLDALIDRTVADRRFYLTLMGAFAALALALATVGVYGVMAYAVGQRTREIGIRLALGAAPGQVQRLVMRAGARMVGLGLFIGLTAAMLASRVMASWVFGITPRDPATLATAGILLGLLGLAAAYVPARRARALDPVTALRRD